MSYGLISIDEMDVGVLISVVSAGIIILYFLVHGVLNIKLSLYKIEKVSNVSNRKLIQEIIWFTDDILKGKGISSFPAFKISFYKHKRYLGVYANSGITIYIKNHKDIRMLISTVLHEVGHHIQYETNRKEYIRYEEYSRIFSHDKNPLEIECCQFADKWLSSCITHLRMKNITRKVLV